MKLREILHSAKNFIVPKFLFEFKALKMEQKNNKLIQTYGYVYFMYLFLYSGLEFTLCFLTHIRFQYDSIQQGKLYFFSGIIMIIIQGKLFYIINLLCIRQKRVFFLNFLKYFFKVVLFGEYH